MKPPTYTIPQAAFPNPQAVRPDHQLIANLVPNGSRVLDVGCNTGELLAHLQAERQVIGHGLELSQAGVNACVAKGLSVVQGNADVDLVDYPDDAFDMVILSRTLQATHAPDNVLRQMARLGKRLIVSFPNFAYWRVRWQLLVTGRMPVNKFLAYQWYDTPNIHLCTIRDFAALAADTGLVIKTMVPLKGDGSPVSRVIEHRTPNIWLSNVRAEQAIFLLERR